MKNKNKIIERIILALITAIILAIALASCVKIYEEEHTEIRPLPETEVPTTPIPWELATTIGQIDQSAASTQGHTYYI